MISRAVALGCAEFLSQPRTLGECAREWGVKLRNVAPNYIYCMRHDHGINIITLQRPGAETRYQIGRHIDK